MGCTASKLDNEDTVRRCKDRRRLIKEAVYARHHLASAHADYCRSLRVTGSALCSFAAGEPISVSEQTPAVFLHTPDAPPSVNSNLVPPRVPVHPSPSLRSSTTPPPPPPPPHFSPPSPTIASSKLPHILSASSLQSTANRRRRKPPKLPHILSESTSPRSQKSNFTTDFEYPTAYQANSTYSRTPSQASSVWNWEKFCPPSPPDSEFFNRKAQAQNNANRPYHYSDADDDVETETETETETERSEYDFFSKKYSNSNHMNMKQQSVVDEETEREEVQCSEWGDHHDHYSTTTSSDQNRNEKEEEEEEEEEEEDLRSRSEIGTRSNFGSSFKQHPTYRNASKSDKL